MIRMLNLQAMALVFLVIASPVAADNKKELRQQRRQAQMERQAQKKERAAENRDNLRALRDLAKELEAEYREQIADLNTEFQLKEVELGAERDGRVAGAEADYQKKISGLFMKPGLKFTPETIRKFRGEAKAYADELFALKKQAAETLHRSWLAKEERKNSLLAEKDRRLLAEAETMGLTRDFAPILAEQIGGELTRSEERWNETEKKTVVKLKKGNLRQLSKYRNGEELRTLEMRYAQEDFQLSWDEKAELHALDSKQAFYSALMMQAGQGGFDQKAFMAELAEDGKKKNLIRIKYRKLADKNGILRQKEKKKVQKR